ncbi:methyl-accepting chemotaxis protein, partial [Ferrovibrio sp.]|uniref:HAMP domain-containing protein n=1 Tax=Ferrovibrio sp. TaxID=1917215 RepID=UPI00260661F5
MQNVASMSISAPLHARPAKTGLRLSVSQKLGFLIAIIVCAAVAATVAVQLQVRRKAAIEDFRNSYLQIITLAAQQVSGGVRWNKPETITPTLEGVAEFEGSALANVVVFDAQRQPIVKYESKRYPLYQELAQDFTPAVEQSLKSGKAETRLDGDDHFIISVPVTAGRDKDYVGALSVALSLVPLNEANARSTQSALYMGGGLLVVLVIALVLGTVLLVSRPLRGITATITDLVAGRQEVVIPSLRRGDEVGDIARSLDVFKAQIAQNQALQRERADSQAQQLAERERSEAERQRQEAELDRAVAMVIEAAVNGDLANRVDNANLNGAVRRIADGINRLLDVTDRSLQQISAVLAGLADGDLSRRIQGDFAGVFARIQNDANDTAEKLTGIAGQLNDTARTVRDASSEISTGSQDLAQRTESQAASIEETA